MPVTININNLTLCHKGSNGISTATIPDVCKTPSPGGPVPIPYPNIAMSMDLMKGTTTVKADGGMMCANYGSEFMNSTGDEPGVAGGVASSTFIKEATWMTFSFDVKLQGKAACRLTDKMFHNHQNTMNTGGEIQAPLKLTENHKCTNWSAEWTDGPLEIFEDLSVSFPLAPEPSESGFINWYTIEFKVKFKGTVQCTCEECGSVKTHTFESPTYERAYKIGFAAKVTDFLGHLVPLGRAGKSALALVKALVKIKKAVDAGSKAVKFAQLLEEHKDDILKGLAATVAAVKAILIASANAICSGNFDVGKLDAAFKAITPKLPSYPQRPRHWPADKPWPPIA